MIKVLTQCPVCDGRLKAVKLQCGSCGTVIENSFDFPPLMQLSREHMEFAEVFLRCRGNIKDVEKELGISYPTVRAKLDQVIEGLSGGRPAPKATQNQDGDSTRREAILKMLESGDITPEEALKSLEGIGKGE